MVQNLLKREKTKQNYISQNYENPKLNTIDRNKLNSVK